VRQAALQHRDPVAVVAPVDHRVGHHLDAGRTSHLVAQRAQDLQLGLASPTKVTAEIVLFLDQQDPGPRLGGGDGRGHAGGTAAGDHYVGVGVAFVEVGVRRVRRDHAARGEAPQDPPVDGPQLPRLYEGLVVEAGGEETTEGPVGRLYVVSERGPDVLGAHDHPRLHAAVSPPDVRLVADLHHAPGV
jgi:hypothetical protein